jgi:hypothetical protein
LHALLLVPNSYFNADYLTLADWLSEIQDAFRFDYAPSIRISKVGTGGGAPSLRKALLETFKYAVKSQDLVTDVNFCLTLTDQLHRLRCQTFGGVLKKLFRELDDDDEEGIDPDLDDFDALWFVKDPDLEPFFLTWNPARQMYVLRCPTAPLATILPLGFHARK